MAYTERMRAATPIDIRAARKGLCGGDLKNFDKSHGNMVYVDGEGREYIEYRYNLIHDTSDKAYLAEEFPIDDGRNTFTGYAEQQPQSTVQPELPGVESTLEERGKRYGSFTREAEVIQRMRRALFADDACLEIPDDCRQAAEMIVVKLVRAMRGDPNYADNWHDISGYARLVEKRLLNDASSRDQA